MLGFHKFMGERRGTQMEKGKREKEIPVHDNGRVSEWIVGRWKERVKKCNTFYNYK